MLTKTQEKLIRSLHRSKGRRETGLCLVEGKKCIETAGTSVEFVFSRDDTEDFDRLVSTETPQDLAAVARAPIHTHEDLLKNDTLIVLDGVQDPGNVGSILRLCLGFRASLLLIDSADPTSPKVIRSSAGAMFTVPWARMKPTEATAWLQTIQRRIFRLEKKPDGLSPDELAQPDKLILVAGSEGTGITLPLEGKSLSIPHNERLESLNVAHALAIALFCRRN